eukprot:gene9889-20578_t
MRVISFMLSLATCSSFFSSSNFRLRANYKSSVSNPLGSFHLVVRDRIQSLSAFTTGGIEVDDLSAIDVTKGMPDKSRFRNFYNSIVKSGKEMLLDEFMLYEDVSNLLTDGVIYLDDINDLWISAVGDASGLDIDEAYEMLCMVMDLPDPEDITYLDDEFKKLAGSKTELTFDMMMEWEDVKDMIKEEALTTEEISSIWTSIVGDKKSSMNRVQFGIFNNSLDDTIFEKEEAMNKAESETTEDNQNIENNDDSEDKVEIDLSTINIWDPDFNPATVFEEEVYNDISTYYRKNAVAGGLSFAIFRAWEEIDELVKEGALSEQDLKSLWAEAPKNFKGLIDFDTFVRLNVRMDVVMDEKEDMSRQVIATASKASTPKPSPAGTTGKKANNAEQYYRQQFRDLTNGGRLIRLDMLLEWPEISELIDEGAITTKQITKMFEGMPLEPMGIPSTEYGINEDSFVAFNGMLDVFIDADSEVKSVVAAPAGLISSETLPKPQMSELKIGSLDGSGSGNDAASLPSDEDDASIGLSPQEMEMMQMLDKADNMLNSGSFGDFDQLIGDVNDPRLEALREQEKEGKEQLQGELKDIVNELLLLGRKQSRCGMDVPAEEEAARLRDLMTAAIEKGPKLAEKSLDSMRIALNGKWKLLYSNSEMFSFYNGITGLVNVFPSSKFAGLDMEMTSDGYLNEAKYYEELTTLLGPVIATVYANWELVKEMSFMTNENSVVLRNYCTKVTAGPFEYMAEENWKSLRAMSLNEMVYIDDKIRIMRNSGALRIFFLYERTD